MGFGIGSLIEKGLEKLGCDEDFADVIGLGFDGGLVVAGAFTPVFGETMISIGIQGGLESADDLIEDLGRDPLTASEWKDRIRRDGYESFEAAVKNGEVSKEVMADPRMQSMRAEHEEGQAAYRDGLSAIAAIEASRTAALRG